MTKLSLINVGKSFEKTNVLKEINLDISLDPPTVYGFVGPNGAGKTTTMKLISGLYLPDNGLIRVGTDPMEYSKWAKENIAYIPAGERGLFYKNTIYDNAMYYGVIKGTDTKVIATNIKKYAEHLKISNILDKRIEQLSTGQKKKAQLLCAISAGKKLLLLDEPSLGLDIDSTFELQNILTELLSSLNISIFISSHNINFLSKVANNYYFIYNGRIIENYNSHINTEQLETKYYELKKAFG